MNFPDRIHITSGNPAHPASAHACTGGQAPHSLEDREPPARRAANYHSFTNMIGGVTMDYIEEAPKKVWIRYTAPMSTYPGTTMLAMPGSLRRRIFTAWHPRN